MNSKAAFPLGGTLALLAATLSPALGQEAPSPAASAAASPTATASPAATAPVAAPTVPPLTYKFVPEPAGSPAPDAPAIIEVDLNDKHLRAHGQIAMRILTSPDVVTVVTRSRGHEGAVPRVGPGEFYAISTLPGVPFVARGLHLSLEFVATNAVGKTTSVRVPVILG